MGAKPYFNQISATILAVLLWLVWASHPLQAEEIIPPDRSNLPESTVQTSEPMTANAPVIQPALFAEQSKAQSEQTVLQEAKNKLYLPIIVVSSTWRQIGADGRDINAIDISNKHLYLADRTNDNSGGIYHIDNCNGATLQKSALSKARTFDVAIKSVRGIGIAFDATTFFSTDRGSQWSEANGALQAGAYAITFGDDKLAYAGSDGGVYRSVNRGESWENFSQHLPNLRLVNELWYDEVAHQLWIGTNQGGVWRWQNESEGFRQLVAGLDSDQAKDVWSIQSATIATTTYTFIGTSNGVYMHTGSDDNAPWLVVGGTTSALNGRRVYSLAMGDEGLLYAGTAGAGLWQVAIESIPQSATWQNVEGGAWPANATVRDLIWDPEICRGLVAATTDGVWVFR